ncbi:unnamed protein product [Pocillopora meandrina]|uniref:Uncharacterized protein n=1 Tax=Pocillopora meandrina TaxID=46732 RepID=A0AAU9XL20_9CNID|nr:unnamed protein product [Pocillopora meandrina]
MLRFQDLIVRSSSVLAIWQRWKAWARLKLSVPVLPAIPLQVALYLTGLVDRTIWQGYSVSPLSHDVITDITLILNTTSASLADIRFLFILLVGYAGVFRITKILSLRVKDIIILDDFMKINLIKCKNDRYRNGHISVLGMSRKPTCPVGIIEDFFFCFPNQQLLSSSCS